MARRPPGAPARLLRMEGQPRTPSAGAGGGAQAPSAAVLAHARALAVAAVVCCESPVHVKDLLIRVAGMWGARVSARVEARILDACRAAVDAALVERRADFLWRPGALAPAAHERGARRVRVQPDRRGRRRLRDAKPPAVRGLAPGRPAEGDSPCFPPASRSPSLCPPWPCPPRSGRRSCRG